MQQGRRTASYPAARDVALFVAACATFVDLLLTGVEQVSGALESGRGPLLDTWDAAKSAAVVVGLSVVAWRARSRAAVLFAAVFAIVGLGSRFGWHRTAASRLTEIIDVTRLQTIVPASAVAWGEFLLLWVLAIIAGVAAWMFPDSRAGFRSATRVLTLFLTLLVCFATVGDLIAASAENGPIWSMVEETGERLVLSATAGYVAGLLSSATRLRPR